MLHIHLGQQPMNPLPFSSRSLRSMGFLKRTFTKSTRNASAGKCPVQLSLPLSSLPFSCKVLAQGAPSMSTLTGIALPLSAEWCLYLALWRGLGGLELGRALPVRPTPKETRQ